MSRITEREFVKGVVDLLARRSTCLKGQVGALALKDGRIIATGYNGAPSGESHCIDVGCDINSEGSCIRTTHAEANLISIAARFGISLEGIDVVCNYSPCFTCARLMVNAKINSLTYYRFYKDTSGLDLLDRADIVTNYFGGPVTSKIIDDEIPF